jgi:hypothetical protein
MLSITDMFKSLGAPLVNPLWSWGAERSADGAIFLRVWQDRCATVRGRRSVRITSNAYFRDKPDSLGNAERMRHVDLIRSGRPAYLLMCTVEDPSAHPRAIAKYNDAEVFVGGELIDHEGDAWLVLAERRPVAKVRPNNSLQLP